MVFSAGQDPEQDQAISVGQADVGNLREVVPGSVLLTLRVNLSESGTQWLRFSLSTVDG